MVKLNLEDLGRAVRFFVTHGGHPPFLLSSLTDESAFGGTLAPRESRRHRSHTESPLPGRRFPSGHRSASCRRRRKPRKSCTESRSCTAARGPPQTPWRWRPSANTLAERRDAHIAAYR